MEFSDYSPATEPTDEQQRDALRKGLGRSMIWARSGKLDESQLLDACLHDLRFDRSVDGCRGKWLWQLVSATDCAKTFRQSLIDALQSLANERDSQQLCELAYHYAALADEPFRQRLYEIVEQKLFSDDRQLGEQQIVDLDGEAGFRFAVRVRGEQLAMRAWDWDDTILADQAIERFGEQTVVQGLRSTEDQATQRYFKAWSDYLQTPSPATQSHKERMQSIPIEEIIAAAEAQEGNYGKFRGWGMHASLSDLEVILRRLLDSTSPKTICDYLRVFSNRALPYIDPALFTLCEHQEAAVRNRALHALAKTAHPSIREFAQIHLNRGIADGAVASLFIRNFRSGDENLLLHSLEPPNDLNQLHGLLMEVAKVLEENPQADGSRLGVVAYALTPCASCRYWTAKHLHKRQVAPQWLMDECLTDVESDTGRLAETESSSQNEHFDS